MASIESWFRLPRRLFWRAQSWLYQPQVRMRFEQSVIREIALPSPPNGYSIRSYEGEADLEPWAQLLNEDGGFGPWDGARIRTELLSQLMTSDSSSLLFHGDAMVGCSCLVDASGYSERTGLGMFMYLKPAHRGKRHLSFLLTFRTLAFCNHMTCDRTFLTTDPERLSALAIYLSHGGLPVKDSLYSHVQWSRIERRLKPTLEALARRRARRAAR